MKLKTSPSPKFTLSAMFVPCETATVNVINASVGVGLYSVGDQITRS